MHPSDQITLESLEGIAFRIKPDPAKVMRFDRVAKASESFMRVILKECPESQDRTAALSAARAARVWANSSIGLERENAGHV